MSKHAHHEHASPEHGRHDQTHPDSEPQQETSAMPPEGSLSPAAEAAAGPSQTETSQAGTGASAEPSVEERLEAANDQIARLKAEIEEIRDKYMRTLAEQVNFRKRMAREKEEAQKYAVSALLVDLVGILDDFDRSIDASRAATDIASVVEGIEMIRRHLSNLLENKYGLKRYVSKGQVFDPNLHEAMFAVPGNVAEPMVDEEFLPGYKLHDRVVRSAKVKVTMPAPSAPAPSASKEEPASVTEPESASSDADTSASPHA